MCVCCRSLAFPDRPWSVRNWMTTENRGEAINCTSTKWGCHHHRCLLASSWSIVWVPPASLSPPAVQQAASPTPLPGCPGWSLPSCWPRWRTLPGRRAPPKLTVKVGVRDRHKTLEMSSTLHGAVFLTECNDLLTSCYTNKIHNIF